MSLAILFHSLYAQHVSDINISIIRSLRLCCWITTSVVVFSVHCVLEILCHWVWVVTVLQAEVQISNTQWTENPTTDVVIQQQSRKLLMMGIVMSKTCWAHKKLNKIASESKFVFYSSNCSHWFKSKGRLYLWINNCFALMKTTSNVLKYRWLVLKGTVLSEMWQC